MLKHIALATSLSVLALSTAAVAQDDPTRSKPMAPALPAPVPVAKDVPYAGTIGLNIDATDLDRGLYHVTETIPVAAGTGEIVLLEPSWLPGHHSPSNPVALFSDIHFQVDGKDVPWVRDTVSVNAFHIKLPAGATAVTAKFVHTSPLTSREGRITMTQEMLNLQWDKMSMYPAGYYTRGITFKPTVKFPTGWTVYTALDGFARTGDTVTWSPIDYERLVDSPIFAGKYAKSFDLGHGVKMNAVADEAKDLEISPENMQKYRNLSNEAVSLFGARHFDHYDFLLGLTDEMGGIGLEHHRSSENQMEPKAWVDWDKMDWDHNVIAHEFTHSWDGKFRRGFDLWTPDYQQPMQDSLLWVYEGQTQFWGYILAARSGVQSKQTVLDMWASAAALYSEGEPGREWRSVVDTTNDPIIAQRAPHPYRSLERSEDYYVEGALTWLEADQIIRAGTKGKKGLDDFAKAFFGVRDGDWGELTYNFDDVVKTLNGVYAYDWATFLHNHIYEPNQPAPIKGIEMAGYKLVWKDKPNSYQKGANDYRHSTDLTYSLGMAVGKDGTISSALWNGPAFKAGLVNGVQIIAVNGKAYSGDVLEDAVTAAKSGSTPIQLLIKREDAYTTVPVAYYGGLRYPWLESTTPGKENGFDRLLAARTK
ncbi:M61 family metallopeptidase [Novosphingobium sp. 9]|uniref:M61 family metallopeptidase n=1 Tax=Novosphingobium sp. 9 TaxID=2025349 RepID=UPI0021B5F713|nr:peptidase M61 [Novosphingobium sp. 9]